MNRLTDSALKALTARERAELAMAAAARGDDAELRRLVDSCPDLSEYRRYAERMLGLAVTLEAEGRRLIINLLLAQLHGTPDEVLELVAQLKGAAEGLRAVVADDWYMAVSGEPSLWLDWVDGLKDMDTPADPAAAEKMRATVQQVLEPNGAVYPPP